MVSHRLLPDVPTMWLRPPSLVVGVGCNRGTSADEIEEIHGVLKENGLSSASCGWLPLRRRQMRLGSFKSRRRRAGRLQYNNGRSMSKRLTFLVGAKWSSSTGCHGVLGCMLAAGATALLVEKQNAAIDGQSPRIYGVPLDPKARRVMKRALV